MNKTPFLLASCICLACSSLAEEVRCRDDLYRFNYSTLLLFDALSGRVMDIVVPQTHEAPFQLREQLVPVHITELHNGIHVKRPPVSIRLGETNVVHMKILGIEFV